MNVFAVCSCLVLISVNHVVFRVCDKVLSDHLCGLFDELALGAYKEIYRIVISLVVLNFPYFAVGDYFDSWVRKLVGNLLPILILLINDRCSGNNNRLFFTSVLPLVVS